MKWNTDIMKIVAIVLVITLVLSLFVRYVMLKSRFQQATALP